MCHVLDRLITQEMCDDAVRDDPSSLQYVPDWFVTREQIDRWYDDDYVYNDNEMIKWYEGHQKRRAQKASIKEELLLIAWESNNVVDWCMSGDEKRRWN